MLATGPACLPRFVFAPPHDVTGPLLLRRTRTRKVVSLRYGRFLAVEKTTRLPGHPELPEVRSRELAHVVPPGGNYAYDLLVRVGIAHHLECRQYAEIQTDLATRFALKIPERTIGHLAREFIAYVQVVHHESAALLRDAMLRRGGYILHVDGTCEEGSRFLLVCIDSVGGQVLGSRKIASENPKEAGEVLASVRDEWGSPLAVVHDMGPALLTATTEVFPGIQQFVCHFHFAADVGKDILAPAVDELRALFRRAKIRAKLGVIRRSLGEFAVGERRGAHVVESLIDRLSPADGVPVEVALGAIHALTSWILAYQRAGNGYGFPFEVPYLEFYDRIVAVHEVLQDLLRAHPAKDGTVTHERDRLHRTLAPLVEGDCARDFARVVADVRRDRRVFEAFRERLRICPREGKRRRNDEGAPAAVDPVQHRTILANFRLGLERKMRSNNNLARACRIVVEHL